MALNELNYFLACILFLPGHLQSRESHFGKTKMSCVSALLLQSNTSLCVIGKGDILCGKCVCIYNYIIPKFFLSHRLDMTTTRLKTRNLASLSSMFPGCRQSHFPPPTLFSENRSTHNCRAGATYKAYCNFQPVRGNVFSGLHF